METIGFIGLGNLGSPMARNIQRAGYSMVVYDVREGATRDLLDGGARLAASPEEVARLCDVTFTSVPGPKEVEEVAVGPHGVLEGIKEGAIYVDLSTSRPALVREIETMFRRKGAHVLDAPVLSTPADAAGRHLIVMPSGEREVYERLHPIFEAFADKVVYAGALGMGSVCKLVQNMMSFAMRQVMAEGLTLGMKAGLELSVLTESGSRGVLGMNSGRLAQTVFRGEYDQPSFRLALSRKDIGLATDLGREVNVPMPVANIVEQMAIQGMNRGWGDRDSMITFLLQEEVAGVELRSGEVAPQRVS